MDIIIKAVAQAPLVALFAYLWWINRKDLLQEKDFLEKANKEKDKQIEQFIQSFEKITITLELIKDRLR